MRKKEKTYASVMKKRLETYGIRRKDGGQEKLHCRRRSCVGNAEPAGCALGAFHVLYIWRHLSD